MIVPLYIKWIDSLSDSSLSERADRQFQKICLAWLLKSKHTNTTLTGIFNNDQKHNDLLQITTGTQISTTLTIHKDVQSVLKTEDALRRLSAALGRCFQSVQTDTKQTKLFYNYQTWIWKISPLAVIYNKRFSER